MTRQTISYLTRRFEQIGLQPHARHGQHFLVDMNLVQLLVRTAQLGPDDVVLEVGTGTGSLTALLAERAAAVITVEIDEHLHQMAREELVHLDNVTLLHQDVLRNKNNLHTNILEAVRAELCIEPNRSFKLAANLPYNIATPVISNLLLTQIVPQTMTVTIQKELADRIVAKPGTKDYGALSIWLQSLCDAEVVRVMPPDVFWPRPKVHSAIVHIKYRQDKRKRIDDLNFFHWFVRAMFFHRRKYLRSVVYSAFKQRLDKRAIDEILHAMQLGPDSRAEQLDIDTMLALCDKLHKRAGE